VGIDSAKNQKKLAQAVKSFHFKSKLGQPIDELPLLRKSLLFAELSSVAYGDEDDVSGVVKELGFQHVEFFDRDGSQAYLLENEVDAVITCRGTEPNEWNDIRADANAITAVAETIGRVHRGFKQEVDDLWPKLEAALVNNTKQLWFCGHSLGGAMATICAGRCMLSHIKSTPDGIFTYGSPRVGDKRYVNYCKLDHYRWVNNNDIVPRVPPPWLGYRHAGREMYLNVNGKIRRLSPWQRTKDRFRGFIRGLAKFRVDHVSDHSMADYIRHIEAAAMEEEASSQPASAT